MNKFWIRINYRSITASPTAQKVRMIRSVQLRRLRIKRRSVAAASNHPKDRSNHPKQSHRCQKRLDAPKDAGHNHLLLLNRSNNKTVSTNNWAHLIGAELTFANYLHLVLIGHVQRVLDVVVDLALFLGQIVQLVFRIVDQCQNLLISVHDRDRPVECG